MYSVCSVAQIACHPRRGRREISIVLDKGVYHLFYDGAGPLGWLACLATSRDLLNWERHGTVLDFGAKDAPDSAAAGSPWVIHDGHKWHMFYVGTPNSNPPPDGVPYYPYLTLKATAPELKGPWTKHYDIRPINLQPDSWRATTASPGFVIKHDDEYLQFFSGSRKHTEITISRTLGLAKTRDLDSEWKVEPEPLFPPEEQIENSSVYFEPTNQLWFLFTNHIGILEGPDGDPVEYTDSIWVYWSDNPRKWNADDKAVVLDGENCSWANHCIGMPSVIPHEGKLALLYDACHGDQISHMKRDIGLAWLDLPLKPPA